MLSVAPTHSLSFPVADLQFARSWAEAAPGFGGWSVLVDVLEDDTGSDAELVSITPPGAYAPAFFAHIDRAAPGVFLEREGRNGGWVRVARVADLRAAVLVCCPLPPTTVAALEGLGTLEA